ncbi:MAG: hypothetical protein CME40_02355 [Haliea sp.]|nr:hypothetical protein [Haliea sp.]|tara:strand:+ start:26400 stop:26993 length:594 start_codon:yes stop_codon:yes gene_type:complete
MQKRLVSVLGVLLALQLLLAWGLARDDGDLAAPGGRQLLFSSLAAEAVEGLRLEGPDGEALVIRRRAPGWQLQGESGDESGVPVDAARVDVLLDRLLALDSTGPVANSESAHDRLRVGEDDFERRISFLGQKGELAVLYLGSAPDMRSVHARVAGESAVHAVAISAWEVPVQPQSWSQPEPAQEPEPEPEPEPEGTP